MFYKGIKCNHGHVNAGNRVHGLQTFSISFNLVGIIIAPNHYLYPAVYEPSLSLPTPNPASFSCNRHGPTYLFLFLQQEKPGPGHLFKHSQNQHI